MYLFLSITNLAFGIISNQCNSAETVRCSIQARKFFDFHEEKKVLANNKLES